jgi:ATP-binding cassette, subfamily C (CFTR/MRP), member 1
MMSFHSAWGAPLFIIAILVMLYVEIQWAAFVGLVAMLLLIPATSHIGNKLGMLRMKIVGLTDQRTSAMAEIINGIRILKFYAWDAPFRCV